MDLSNTIAVKYPESVKEWSPNNKVGPDKVSYGSKTLRLWICENGHEYSCSPKDKFLRNFRCQVCYPYKLKFIDVFPEYAKYYSPNNIIPIEDLVKCDVRPTLWICERGHEQTKTCEKISENGFTCRQCYEETIAQNTQHLTDLYPQIRDIWDYGKNNKIPDTIPLSSRDTFYFKCSLGHEYENEIRSVLNNNCECLVCTNKKIVAGYNDFKSKYPELIERLSPETQKVVDRILGVENKYLDWICLTCGGEYLDTVENIASGINNCPYCSNKRVLPGFNDFETVYPELIERLSSQIKGKADEIVAKEDKTLIWECPNCHGEYNDTISNLANGINNCPYCTNKKALKGFNDLASKHPELIGRLTDELKSSANKIVCLEDKYLQWRCQTCKGVYYDSIGNMIKGLDNCPYCAGKKVLPGYNDLAILHPEILNRLIPKLKENANNILCKNDKNLTWICPTCNGEYLDSIGNILGGIDNCPYCSNKKALKGFNDLQSRHPELVERLADELKNTSDKIIFLEDKYLQWKCQKCNGVYYDSISNMIKGLDNCPYCNNKRVLSGFNDFATRHPDLVDEAYSVGNYMIGTDLTKNKDDSNKLAYWICLDCKHIYPMKIVDRVIKQERGHNPCPRCNYVSKKKIFVF